MFRWYKKASICYAYLEDVKYGYRDRNGGLFHLLCQDSRWFTRGWTLQELIAPEDVKFYGEDWGYLGSKAHDEDVRIALADITGIDIRVLEGTLQPSEIGVAARMKWASQRKTTRLEDMAYCLMGLFDVNMPLLYGEGTKAFIRLQDEILKSSYDPSIFTWSAPEGSSNEVLSGLLAETPHHFTYAENYRPMPPLTSQGSTTWSTTNQGLRLSLFLLPSRDSTGNKIADEYDAILECSMRRGDEAYMSPAIRMKRLYGDQFARIEPQVVTRVLTPAFDPSYEMGSYEIVFVKQKPVYAIPEFMVSFSNILSSSRPQGPDLACYITKVWPERYWDEDAAILRPMRPVSDQIIGLFRFYAPTVMAMLDFAVGFKRRPGGTWVTWHLQRPSMGEPLDRAAESVTAYRDASNQYLQKLYKSIEWLKNPWREEGQNGKIRVRIEEMRVHGRLYHFIKASPAFELHGFSTLKPPNSPDSSIQADAVSQSPLRYSFVFGSAGHTNPAPPAKPSTEDEAIQTHVPTAIEELLEDPTTQNYIDRCLEFVHLISASKERSKIRTAWAHYPTAHLKRLLVHGVGEISTKLLRACKDGRNEEVSELIPYDLECASWINGFRPIHWAAVGGHIEVIHTLLENGADLHSRTFKGWSAIHLAAFFGRFMTMKWLLEYAIEKYGSSYEDQALLDDRSNPLQENPLHLAVSHVSRAKGDELLALTEILKILHNSAFWISPNYVNETPLHRLAASGPIRPSPVNTPIVEELLSYEQRFPVAGKCLDGLGRTILWHAACAGSASEVEYLAEEIISPSTGDKNGMAPLHAACRLGHTEVTKALLEAGANPDATTKTPGLTAAHFAALFDHPGCLRELIIHGADIHKPTDDAEISFQPIHLAAANGNSESLSIILSAGGDMDSKCTHYVSIPGSSLKGAGRRYELVKWSGTARDLPPL
ncbi:hypothetical protein O1611_g6395 [Lasiodiplodia mahajangana]|uniref:Uncharacterized protein n=1 Tax=Lasiodiplodia mahajangana TaxID=1108764 RepID=A0ACC2JIP6_9PEZI|nr:hypothetical protein O1611_g6395 [Lasiodiplodia mahajangana]